MRSTLLVLVIVAGCARGSSPSAAPPEPAPVGSPLLAAVGAQPRGYAILSLTQPLIREQLEKLAQGFTSGRGKSLKDCGIALEGLGHIRVAIGAPLRIAAELDGKLDVHAITCLLGDATMSALARAHVVIRDRAGGIAIDYQTERTGAEPARVAAIELVKRCGDASCAAIALGPSHRHLWVRLQIGKTIRLELSGPSLGRGAAAFVAAIDHLRATTPVLEQLVAREQQGALVVELPSDLTLVPSVTMALSLRAQLLESFKIASSSMVPSLLVDDQIFVAKGPLLGELVPGDLLAHNHEANIWVTRYLAGPGQTIAETEAGISIDGKPLATEVVDAGFHYRDRDEATGRVMDRSGTVVREHLGARSYLTLRTGPPNQTGTWTVPAGHVFLVGDSRNNSNDSRYLGASPKDAVIGRVLGVWLAFRDGAPDWDRMGMPVE